MRKTCIDMVYELAKKNKKIIFVGSDLGSVGFFVIWICYLGVNFLGKGLHSYGWLS